MGPGRGPTVWSCGAYPCWPQNVTKSVTLRDHNGRTGYGWALAVKSVHLSLISFTTTLEAGETVTAGLWQR